MYNKFYCETAKIATFSVISLASSLVFASDDFSRAVEHIKNLPTPPEGYKWVVNPDFTDEFDGDTLDSSKWYDKSPYWKNGRPPATFKAENVSVGDGCLQIKSSKLKHPEGNDGKPGNKYTYAGGAVASKADNAFYGYYEVKMKASFTPMSSTFWMKNVPIEVNYVDTDGKLKKFSTHEELDIIETMGTPTRFPEWGSMMNSNMHAMISTFPPFKIQSFSENFKGEREKFAPSCDDFHTYGCWWIDANTLNFYHDGKFMFTVHPSNQIYLQSFSRPMYMHMVTETYDWEPTLPSAEVLADDTKNRAMYDWVRSYRLVRDNDALIVDTKNGNSGANACDKSKVSKKKKKSKKKPNFSMFPTK